jgi:hypothetical protein
VHLRENPARCRLTGYRAPEEQAAKPGESVGWCSYPFHRRDEGFVERGAAFIRLHWVEIGVARSRLRDQGWDAVWGFGCPSSRR